MVDLSCGWPVRGIARALHDQFSVGQSGNGQSGGESEDRIKGGREKWRKGEKEGQGLKVNGQRSKEKKAVKEFNSQGLTVKGQGKGERVKVGFINCNLFLDVHYVNQDPLTPIAENNKLLLTVKLSLNVVKLFKSRFPEPMEVQEFFDYSGYLSLQVPAHC